MRLSYVWGLFGFLFYGYQALWLTQIIDLGFSLSQVSFLVTIQLLLSLVIELPGGILADIYGYRKITLIGAIIGTIGTLAPALKATSATLAFAVVSLVIGEAFVNGALDGWTSHSVSLESNKNKASKVSHFFTREVWWAIGKISGAIIIPGFTTLCRENTQVTWILYFISGLVLCAFTLRVPDVMAVTNSRTFLLTSNDAKSIYSELRQIFTSKLHSFFLLATFIFGASNGLMEIALRPKLQTHGLKSSFLLGLFWALLALSRICGQRIYLKIFGSRPALSVSTPLFLAAPFFAASALIDDLTWAVPFWLLRVAVLAAYFPLFKSYVTAGEVEIKRIATILSAYTAIGTLGSALSSFTLGEIVFGKSQLDSILAVGAFFMLCSAFIYKVGASVNETVPNTPSQFEALELK